MNTCPGEGLRAGNGGWCAVRCVLWTTRRQRSMQGEGRTSLSPRGLRGTS